MAAVLPGALLDALRGLPRAGEWYPVHQLLTAADGPPAVCLLSQAELRAAPTTMCVAARSSRAAANLAVRPSATLVSWAGGLHYITLDLRDTAERDGVHGYLFDVRDLRTDDIGIELIPLQYRMEAWLTAAERWETSNAVLEDLASRANG
jgi:hypothetical protein